MRLAYKIAFFGILMAPSSPMAQVTLDRGVLQRSYPAFAQDIGVGGKVLLHCAPANPSRYDCQVVSEAPAGFGFAQAALEASRTLRAPGISSFIDLPLAYVPPDGPSGPRPAPSPESRALAIAFVAAGGLPNSLSRARGNPPKVGWDQLSPRVRAAAETVFADWRGLLVEAFVNMEARQIEANVPVSQLPALTAFVTSEPGRELLGLLAKGQLDKRAVKAWADRRPDAAESFQKLAPSFSAMAVPQREAEARLRLEFEDSVRRRLCEQVQCTS